MSLGAALRLAVLFGCAASAACGLDWTSRPADASVADAGEADASATAEPDAAAMDAQVDASDAESAPADAGSDAAQSADDLVPEGNLLLWLRADRGVSTSGDKVLAWADQSPMHADTGQLTGDYRPSWISAAPAAPAVVFDGLDDYLSVPPGFDDFSAGFTFVAVVALEPADIQVPLFEASNGRELDDLNVSRFDGGVLLEVDDSYLVGGDLTDPALQILVITLSPGLDALARQNGVVVSVAKLSHLPATVQRNAVYVGKSLYNDTKTFGGALHELLVYGRALADAEVLALEARLVRRWGCCGK